MGLDLLELDTVEKGLLLLGDQVAKIVLIDDDYATEILVENLQFRGHEAVRFASAASAMASLDQIMPADLVILDIIMERAPDAKPTISGDRTTGMTLLQTLRAKRPDVPILVFSATQDGDLVETVGRMPHTTFLSKWSTPSMRDFISVVDRALGTPQARPNLQTFIVHGHDSEAKYALKNYLQNTLGFPEPTILHEQPNLGRTIIEKLEDYASATDLVFVLLTPDDNLASGNESNDDKRRARQNVIFELGYFLGVFGRLSGRVFLLHKGPLDMPSDLSGIIYIDIADGVGASGELIRKELADVIR